MTNYGPRPRRRFDGHILLAVTGEEFTLALSRRISSHPSVDASSRSVHRRLADRWLTERTADLYAIAVGLHPDEVWSDWYETPTEISESGAT